MLDIAKKYWIYFGQLNVKCSVICANVVCDLSSQLIPEKTKKFFLSQRESKNTCLPTAYPNDLDSISNLMELEKLGYVVFYDVDEPIGHDLSEDELYLSEDPFDETIGFEKSLNETRQEAIQSIVSTWNSKQLNSEEIDQIFDIPVKYYGIDWY